MLHVCGEKNSESTVQNEKSGANGSLLVLILILSGYETKRCVVQRKIKLHVAHLSTFERVNKDYETPRIIIIS